MPRVRLCDFDEALLFEMLLTELSARFVSATSESIDAEIVNEQKEIVEVPGLDRSTLAQLQEPDRFVVTHCWAIPGVEPIPGLVTKDLPWTASALARGEEVRFTRVGNNSTNGNDSQSSVRVRF